ncbi:hypothetical protein GCM10022419_108180 [Nonomuraea rosea]|uniref:Lipoprotein n=1 Tax=Nonomuraea rosea TaxID=638574 RepID=A0ABP6ZF51_9ACTN
MAPVTGPPGVRSQRRVAGIVGAALACGLLAACAVTPDDAGPGPATLTDADEALLKRAELLLVQACMKRQGFRYWVPEPPAAQDRRGAGFVLDDPAWAREHGYGLLDQRQMEESKRNDLNKAYRDSLPPADRTRYSVALGGGGDNKVLTATLPDGGTIHNALGGCQAYGKERLYGDRQRWFRLEKTATNLVPLYMRELTGDPRFSTALTAWSACMRRHRHTYVSPSEIRAALPGLTADLAPDRAHALEVELAVAEATCARTSSLADTVRALQARYRAKVHERFAAELDAHGRVVRGALERARKISESGA